VSETTQTAGADQEKAEDPKVAAREAEQGFADGFNSVHKAHDEKPSEKPEPESQPAEVKAPEKSATELAAEAKAKEETERKAAEEKVWEGVPAVVRERLTALDALPGQVRNLAGHIGGLNSKLDGALTAAKAAATKAAGSGAAPTDKEVKAAMSNPKAWEKLKEDFPDWAGPVEEELGAIRAEIAKAKPVDTDALSKQVAQSLKPTLQESERRIREFTRVDSSHPDWEDTVKTPDFKAWLTTQPTDVQALAASDKARDAIKLLDAFKVKQTGKATLTPEEERLKKQQRLEQATTPKGAASPRPSTPSDEAEFAAGFNKVAKAK